MNATITMAVAAALTLTGAAGAGTAPGERPAGAIAAAPDLRNLDRSAGAARSGPGTPGTRLARMVAAGMPMRFFALPAPD